MSKVKHEITVNAPVDVVYGAWRNFANFPNFMESIAEVRVTSRARSHWKARGPLGAPAEWDAELTLDEPGRAIGWRSIEGSGNVKTAGRVNFAPAGEGTRIEVTVEYHPPAGLAGEAVAAVFANPERRIAGDLERFRAEIEKGAELSRFTYGEGTQSAGQTLGGSMGALSERDLDKIGATNSGAAPTEVDDPATRSGLGGSGERDELRPTG